jgi:regulator of RNase E activity RraA
MVTTFRADVVGAIRTVLLARKTTSPTLLRAVYNARPGSFPETPCAYIAGRNEFITYSAQTRARTMVGLEVVIVDTLQDASEEADRMDVLIDLLVEDFTAAYAAVSGGGGLLQLGSVTDADVTLTGDVPVTYRGAVLNFGNTSNPTFIREGRA